MNRELPDVDALHTEIHELRAEVVRLEHELGIERGERVKFQARAHEEHLRANAGWAACGRVASARMYQIRRIVTFPFRFTRRAVRAVARRVRARLRRR